MMLSGKLPGLGTRARVVAVFAALLLVVTSCGDDDGGGLGDLTPSGGELMRDLGSARSAVIQIVAEGGFVDPQTLQQSSYAGAGSGFIISPDGLAVTNNHVVTGAALLRVYREGQEGAANARVLGVSECNDLAVIDIEGDGFPYLEWYRGDITVGLPVFAAGYPLGDPQYTLVDGIVAKEESIGEFLPWASVDHVIEHSADALPGNSGGPVLTEDGKVAAVHFAGRSDSGQAYAIHRDIAMDVVDLLSTGIDIDTIGVNGEAFELDGYSGIWVSAVASGSSADKALVRGGDLILSMEGQPLAADGSMSDYCDILRTHDPEDTLSIEVYRSRTGEMLEGQLNGRELVVIGGGSATPGTQPTTTQAVGSGGTVENDFGNIRAAFPPAWGDIETACEWGVDGVSVGPCLAASGDRNRFYNSWDVGGVFISASVAVAASAAEYLDNSGFFLGTPTTDCASYEGRIDYDDNVYTGLSDSWSGCGPSGNGSAVTIAALPADQSFLVVVHFRLANPDEVGYLQGIIESFFVDNADF
jgi:serine protease Do